MRGLEPPRCHHHRLLRPARLPVPPHPQRYGESHYANAFRECQEGLPATPIAVVIAVAATPGHTIEVSVAVVVPAITPPDPISK